MDKHADENAKPVGEIVRRSVAGGVATVAIIWVVCLLRRADGPAAGASSGRETIAALLLSLSLVTGFRSLDVPFANAAGRRNRTISHASAAVTLWLTCFAAIWVTLFASAALDGYLADRGAGLHGEGAQGAGADRTEAAAGGGKRTR